MTAWSITRTEHITSLLTDPRVSRDPRLHWPGFDEVRQPGWLMPWTAASMLNAHGADHVRLRRLISGAFTHRRIQALRPAVTRIVGELLDELGETAVGAPVDLRRRFSFRIPNRVICDLLGVPADQRELMARVFEAAVDTSLPPEQARANNEEMFGSAAALIDRKRAEPGDDMTSRLLQTAEEDGDRLSAGELVATIVLMVGAGTETTVSLMNHAAVALMTLPGQLETVRRDPARWADAIEETLRLDSPVGHLPLRYAAEDIDLDGVVIKRGEPILIAFAAPGRDPAAHASPDDWHLDREDRSHLAFGHGVHFCLGAPLARLQAAIALPALFDRYPGIRLATDPAGLRKRPSFIANDFEAVPVHLWN